MPNKHIIQVPLCHDVRIFLLQCLEDCHAVCVSAHLGGNPLQTSLERVVDYLCYTPPVMSFWWLRVAFNFSISDSAKILYNPYSKCSLWIPGRYPWLQVRSLGCQQEVLGGFIIAAAQWLIQRTSKSGVSEKADAQAMHKLKSLPSVSSMPQASCCLSGSWAGWGHLPALTTYFFWPDLLTDSVIGVTFHWVCGFSNVCIKAQIKLPGEDKDPQNDVQVLNIIHK